MNLTFFFVGHSYVSLVVYFGSLSCWKTHSYLQLFGRWKKTLLQDFTAHSPIHWPLYTVKSSCTHSRKTAQSTIFPPLTVGIVFFRSYSSLLLHQTLWVKLLSKSSILFSSDYITFFQGFSKIFRCSLANLRGVCKCAFLSRKTLWALQDLVYGKWSGSYSAHYYSTWTLKAL